MNVSFYEWPLSITILMIRWDTNAEQFMNRMPSKDLDCPELRKWLTTYQVLAWEIDHEYTTWSRAVEM